MNTTDTWVDCYWRGWGKELVPEAYSHPAKVSFPLAACIYAHIMAEGWVPFGSTVIDPFAGIGGFAYHVLFAGLNFVGVELEEKFVALGQQNIALWNRRYAGRFAKWGTARIVQGDSRHLLDVVREAGICVSSPPYLESLEHGGTDRATKLQGGRGGMPNDEGYGTAPGQLGQMPEGSFDAVVKTIDDSGKSEPSQNGVLGSEESRGQAEKIQRPGRLAEIVVSSPPYEGGQVGRGQLGNRKSTGGSNGQRDRVLDAMQFGYSDMPENLGNDTGDSFWSAAREIVAQTYAALRPGGHAVWVVKSFVRRGAIVDFPGQWRALCESVGFTTLHEHHALLIKDNGTQLATDGNHKRKRVEHKSFFRRLHEKKFPGTEIDFEVVLCMIKQ